jgi:hypothetical protein
MLLSSVCWRAKRTLAGILIQPSGWYEKHGIHPIAATTPLRLTRLRGEWRSLFKRLLP